MFLSFSCSTYYHHSNKLRSSLCVTAYGLSTRPVPAHSSNHQLWEPLLRVARTRAALKTSKPSSSVTASNALFTGRVSVVKDGIITIIRLPALKAGELVYVQTTGRDASAPAYLRALVLNLNENNAQGILLGNERLVAEGALVYRSSSLFRLQCSLGLFGQVLDGLGDPKLNSSRATSWRESAALVEQKATGIIDREPVRIPLRTGLKSIDSLIPIGRGQRELIIGDRQTGKTSVALDAILNHVRLNQRYRSKGTRASSSTTSDLRSIVWFVYNAIGQKQSTVNQFRRTLLDRGALWFTAIVASTAAESAPLQFLSPYTACTLGEFIRDIIGGHCTIIYDDLSKHAVAYRQMSLLLRRPPGREAFPGDVFYVHSRLLERAGSLTTTKRAVRGTLTAFPVIETQAGDVSAYIPTNVISITDGQIFLETELFYRGIRPAVNVGLSVSRVGSAAQPGIMKKVAGSLKMELAQYREIEGFSKLGASLDDQTQRILQRGENLIELLKQNLHVPLTTLEQVVSIFLGVGYSGSWLQDMQRVSVPRHKPATLYNRRRVRHSWLEWLRSGTPDFTAGHVTVFVDTLLQATAFLGLTSLNLYVRPENLLLTLLKRSPILFFDDLIVTVLGELSTLTPTTMWAVRYARNDLRPVRLGGTFKFTGKALLERSELSAFRTPLRTLFAQLTGAIAHKTQRTVGRRLNGIRRCSRWVQRRLFRRRSSDVTRVSAPFTAALTATGEFWLSILLARRTSRRYRYLWTTV